jgi:hypothetical protein
MKFSDLNLLEIGHDIQLVGSVWAGKGMTLICPLPDEDVEGTTAVLRMNKEEWTAFLRQTDLLETEVLAKSEDGTIVKAILRKSQRQIDQSVSWAVFRRDGYRCQYCWNGEVPLTVDHLVLWEDGGPSTEANLLTACKKCNKTRGNKKFHEWLKHPHYLRTSQKIPEFAREAHQALIPTLDKIPRNPHVKSR